MRKLSTIIASLLFANIALAQPSADLYPGPNLVANPSFEDLRRAVPASDLDGSIAFRNSVDKWMSPTNSTPDLLFGEKGGEEYGEDSPRTGEAMVAILTHNPSSKRSDTYREYVQIKLEKPLVAGKEYYVEFWTRRSLHSKMTSNNIGLALSPVPTMNQDWRPLTEIHPLVNTDEIVNPGKTEWVKVSHTFKAPNRERFLLIGNFFTNRNTKFGEAEDTPGVDMYNNAYYLIDDVGLWEINTMPEPEPEPEEPVFAAQPIEVGQVIRLDRIYFEFDKSNLLPASFEELDQLLNLLHQYPSMKIAIHGHTDSRGSDSYNLKLSDSRSEAVYNYLEKHGIPQDRIAYQGFGEEKPIATNDTDEGRQMNRRVEFVVLSLDADNVSVENVNEGF